MIAAEQLNFQQGLSEELLPYVTPEQLGTSLEVGSRVWRSILDIRS
jgi:hypothetical protein